MDKYIYPTQPDVRTSAEKTLAELAQQYDVHPNQIITAWKAQVMEGVVGLFGSGAAAGIEAAPAVDVKVLHAKLGELTLEVDFLAGALDKAGPPSARR